MKRHRFDPYSFVFGLGFAVLGLVFYTEVDLAALSGAGWLPFPAVILGLLLLAIGLDRVRPSKPAAAPESVDAAEDLTAGLDQETHLREKDESEKRPS